MISYDTVSKNSIYVDIDSLLDTRLALLDVVEDVTNSSIIEKIFKKDSTGLSYYDGRLMDEFDFVGKSIFKLFNMALMGDKDLLKSSYLTKITDLVNIDILNIKNSLTTINNGSPVEIVINYYPYVLNNAEEEYLEGVFNKLFTLSNVSIVLSTNDPLNLTLESLNTKYYSLYMYNGLDWLEYIMATSDLTKDTAPSLKLVVPALVNKPIEDLVSNKDKIFEQLKAVSSSIIDLNPVPIEYFNINIKK